jgi:hypothetical protein
LKAKKNSVIPPQSAKNGKILNLNFNTYASETEIPNRGKQNTFEDFSATTFDHREQN